MEFELYTTAIAGAILEMTTVPPQEPMKILFDEFAILEMTTLPEPMKTEFDDFGILEMTTRPEPMKTEFDYLDAADLDPKQEIGDPSPSFWFIFSNVALFLMLIVGVCGNLLAIRVTMVYHIHFFFYLLKKLLLWVICKNCGSVSHAVYWCVCGNLLVMKIYKFKITSHFIFISFQSKSFSSMSVARLMAVIALSDTIVLLMVPFNKPFIRQVMLCL